jgi:membrane protein CcdC involved in cytochrome C biogenesis
MRKGWIRFTEQERIAFLQRACQFLCNCSREVASIFVGCLFHALGPAPSFSSELFMLPINGMSILGSLAGMAAVLAWRVREGRTAVTLKKIVIPPLGMATGFSMFLVPAFRIPLEWAISAFLIGAVGLAYPLLRSSRLVCEGEAIMMKRSNAFFLIVIALAVIRIAARSYIDTVLNLNQTAALFFVLAFGMILRWRLSMFFEYRQLTCA